MSGIQVVEVRIRNFRSLREINIKLDRLTVLIGTNNSGKTAFLEAMSAALGATKHAFSEDDIFLAARESKVPTDRAVVIDILVRPVSDLGEVENSFPMGSSWLELWGTGITQDRNDNDFMAFRTKFTREDTVEYNCERKFLAEWPDDPKESERARLGARISSTQLEPMSLYFMDAKRDFEEDLRRQGSFWRRLTSDLGLTANEVEAFETALNDINEQIVSKSEVLQHVRTSLGELQEMVANGAAGVEVTPVASHLRDLGKAVDVTFATKGAQSFSLARHGMGTRSVASLLIFRAYVDWRCKRAKKLNKAIHPLLALEEPEAHLHPQAQRALFREIESIPGQLIVSSHSPYFAGQALIQNLRHFSKADSETTVSALDMTILGDGEEAKINRMVINTRGDVLYAHGIVAFEGETEEMALPCFAEKYWGKSAYQMGISFVPVNGYGNYLPFLRMAESLSIPWFVFSDGEPRAIEGVTKALDAIGIGNINQTQRVIVLPNGNNFERFLVESGYSDAVETMFAKVEGASFVDNQISQLHGMQKSKNCTRDYRSEGGRERALFDLLESQKTRYGRRIAEEICALQDPNRHFPAPIKKLFEVISSELSLEKK